MKFGINEFILIGCAAILGYYIGLFSRKVRLPSLIGYMLLGVLLGVSGFNLLTEEVLGRISFISEITLAFIAFVIGTELKISSLKRLGFGVIAIIFTESFFAFIFVSSTIFALTRDIPMAFIFGAMAPASAPAGTVHVIQENKAKGSLTSTLYAVVGFDDGLAIIIFGFAATIAKNLLISEATGIGASLLPNLLKPLVEILLSFLVGGCTGLLFSWLVGMLSHEHDRIILVFGFIFITTGLSILLHLSLILTNMVLGFVFVNTRRTSLVQSVLRQTQVNMPLLFILFFCLAGAHMKLLELPALGLIGALYIISRSAGLILGARLGCIIGKVEEKIKKYLGYGILSQAGVAIGLAIIVKQEFAEIGSSHADFIGASILTTITATSIFFEIIGPIFTKIALEKAGEIPALGKKQS